MNRLVHQNDLELLSPAGDIDSFRAAIANGANAVYLGLATFNARIKAPNFTEENIGEIVRYAHLHSVKVYLAVNTLVKSNEFVDLLNVIRVGIAANIDAYIVQDLGVAKFLRDNFSEIVLHASTQLGVHNLYGAVIAEKMGFTRVVLSRETKLEDIKQIKNKTKLEIEFFVQGALCVAFSGNCYMSSFACGESGNRGRCAQLCRLPYQAKYGEKILKEGFLMSAHDLSLIDSLPELIEAGVTSFKIEGRLRRAGYVAVATRVYREALEDFKRGEKIVGDNIALSRAFSRGEFCTRAYLDEGTPENIIGEKINNHLGTLIGAVAMVKPFKNIYEIIVNSPNHRIQEGDGLKVLRFGRETASLGVGNVYYEGKSNYRLYSKNNLSVNDQIYLTLDSAVEANELAAKHYIEIVAKVTALANMPLTVNISHNDTNIIYESEFIVPEAEKSPTSREEIKYLINRTGDTDFRMKEIEVISDNVFVPKSVINNARREALCQLEERILHRYNERIKVVENKKYEMPQLKNISDKRNIIIVSNEGDLEDIADLKNESYIVVLAPSKYTKDSIIQFKDCISKFPNLQMGLSIPIIASHVDICIMDDIIDALGRNIILFINNIYGLYYIEKGYNVIASSYLNAVNLYSSACLYDFGVQRVVDGFEAIDTVADTKYSLGRPALMTYAHCPFKSYLGANCTTCKNTDNLQYLTNKGAKFKLRRYRIGQCYYELIADRLLYTMAEKKSAKLIDVRNLSSNEIEMVQKLIIG